MAVLWAVVFYCMYGVAFAVSLTVPIVFVVLGRWVDRLLGHFGLTVPPAVDQLTVVAAAYADVLVVYVFVRTLFETFLSPTGVEFGFVSSPAVELTVRQPDPAVHELSQLVNEVTKELNVSSFLTVTLEAQPVAATQRSRLNLGWPLLYNLTRNELLWFN